MGEDVPAAQRAAYQALRDRSARALEGRALASQDIRSMWTRGQLRGSPLDEARIQPASMDPVLSSEAYWIRMEGTGGFRPRSDATIAEIVAGLGQHDCIPVDISKGQVIHPGQTWLVRLKERISLAPGMYVKSSPKSSTGRTFLYARLLSDHNASFDEIHGGDLVRSARPVETGLWVLLQPLCFSHVIGEDLTLIQLRFFSGRDSRLTDRELQETFEHGWPLLTIGGAPVNPVLSEGLQFRLDLEGAASHGVVGLRARQNPMPIDMREVRKLEPEAYFDIIHARDGGYVLRRGELCLFLTLETVNVPTFLSCEARAHSAVAFAGPKHFAGFVDNSFSRPLVLEVRSDEIDDVELSHGMPIGKYDFFWTGVADKQYGKESRSNYFSQSGPQPSKHFRSFDWSEYARKGNVSLEDF